MNYVQHTRAAHERLLNEPAARPQHMSLYWALFFEWNAERFPAAMSIDRAAVMAAARIGSRDTYTTTIRALECFGLLKYKPSHSNSGSSVSMTELGPEVGPEVGQPKPAGMPRSGPTKKPEVSPEVGIPVSPEVGQPEPEVSPEVGQHSLLYKTVDINSDVNSAALTEKKIGEVFQGEGKSTVEVLDDTAPPNDAVPALGAAPKKKVAPKKKGVHEARIRAAATAGPTEPRRRGGRPARPELPFTQSAINTPELFAAAFEGTDYALADLSYYFQRVSNWRDKKTGEPPHRTDWIATARTFMLNDVRDNCLKLAPNTQRHEPGTSSSPPEPGSPTTGYRSKRWD